VETTGATEDDADLSNDEIRTLTLHDFATVWAVQQARFAWLVGAGISASAGVPLASSIRDQLLFDRYAAEHQLVRQELDDTDPSQVQRVHAYFDGKNGMPPLGSDGDYSAAFDLCLSDPAARKVFLRDRIEHVKPAFAQRVFGGLVVSGACDLVITTNFDRLLEQGISEAQRAGTDLLTDQQRELNVAGIDSTARATTAIENREWPLVVKLHGDFREKHLKNTDSELQTQDEALRQFVIDVSRQFGLVVSGYSGRDQSVMQMLTATVSTPDAWPQGIWWFVRPGTGLSPAVRALLKTAAANKVAANVVVAASFDETMSALSRQVTVDDYMRGYFNRLHPKPRAVPAAIPTPTRNWPVLRFNALPILEGSITATKVAIPAGWGRGDVRRALHPRRSWPVAVNGPGEMLCVGDPKDALAALVEAGRDHERPAPGPAETVSLDLLADDAPFHHHTLLLQAVARAITIATPVRMHTDGRGAPELVINSPAEGEPSEFEAVRTRLKQAYQTPLFGSLAAAYGQAGDGKNRRWAEMVALSFENRGGQPWLLFRPWTWIAALPRADDEVTDRRARDDLDPANPWRAEQWAQRRFNERWAAIIAAWTDLVAPHERTELTITSATGNSPVGRVVLGRTNAYSRPA
jgi:SIR2-like domain